MTETKKTKKKPRTPAQVKATKRNRRKGRLIENKIADILGAIRGGAYGGEDAFDSHFSIEVKDRKAWAGESIMKQAEANNKNDKIAIYVVHPANLGMDNSHVCMRLKDWLRIKKAIAWGKVK